MSIRNNILIVDTDNAFLHTMRNEFAAYANLYQVAFATCSSQAMKIMKKFVVHIVALNINLSGESGIDLLFWVREVYPNVRVVLYTEEDVREEYKRTLLYGGASAVLHKPFHAGDLVGIADNLYRNKNSSSDLPYFVKLADLLQMIASENNSARLEVTDSATRMTGIITVQNGSLATAITTTGQTSLEALAQMLTWKEPAITASKLPSLQDGEQAFGLPLAQAVAQAITKLNEADT